MHNIVLEASVLKLKKHLGRWRRKAVQVEMLAEVFLLWMLIWPTEESKKPGGSSVLCLGCGTRREFSFITLDISIWHQACVRLRATRGRTPRWMRHNLCLQLVKRTRSAFSWWRGPDRDPCPVEHVPKKDINKVVGTSWRSWRLRERWKEFWKIRIYNKQRSEIWVVGSRTDSLYTSKAFIGSLC